MAGVAPLMPWGEDMQYSRDWQMCFAGMETSFRCPREGSAANRGRIDGACGDLGRDANVGFNDGDGAGDGVDGFGRGGVVSAGSVASLDGDPSVLVEAGESSFIALSTSNEVVVL